MLKTNPRLSSIVALFTATAYGIVHTFDSRDDRSARSTENLLAEDHQDEPYDIAGREIWLVAPSSWLSAQLEGDATTATTSSDTNHWLNMNDLTFIEQRQNTTMCRAVVPHQ